MLLALSSVSALTLCLSLLVCSLTLSLLCLSEGAAAAANAARSGWLSLSLSLSLYLPLFLSLISPLLLVFGFTQTTFPATSAAELDGSVIIRWWAADELVRVGRNASSSWGVGLL